MIRASYHVEYNSTLVLRDTLAQDTQVSHSTQHNMPRLTEDERQRAIGMLDAGGWSQLLRGFA